MSKIVIVGSANIDLVAKVPRMPTSGETLMGHHFQTFFGGKGANQAVAAARAGGIVEFIGCIGADDFGSQYLENFRNEGIRTALVQRTTDQPTGCALIFVADQGENMIVVCPGANGTLIPAHLDNAVDSIRNASIVVLQFEVPLETVKHVITIANEYGVPVVLNPSPLPPGFQFGSLKLDYLIVNEVEANALTGQSASEASQIKSAVQNLFQNVSKAVIVTRGAESTVVVTPETSVEIPTFAVTPVDTVGAGDTFAGAFSVAVAQGQLIEDAVRFGNCAAALATTRLGAQSSMPQRDEILSTLNSRQIAISR